MKPNSTASVIVPIYKPNPEWLEACLHSIRSQTYPVELVTVEDTEGKGAWHARNLGLEKATGDYIAFCDADDYLEPFAIERMVEAIDGDVDMVVGSFRKFGEWEQTVSHPTVTWGLEKVADYVMWNLRHPMHNQLLSGCWAKMYRKSLVRLFPRLTTAEDTAFNFDYLSRCCYVRVLEDVVYNNRKHSDSLSTAFDEKDKWGLFRVMEALMHVRNFLTEFYSEDVIDQAIDNSKVYHAMLYYMRICNQTKLPMREVLMKLYQ